MVIYRIGKYIICMPPRITPKNPAPLFIAEWREEKDLTQQELADKLGTSDVTISRWETRKRKPDNDAQEAIAEVLGIHITDLRRHPDEPSADALLRDQSREVVDQAIKLIQAIRR